jgi:tungstate transport system ATP-binding protein
MVAIALDGIVVGFNGKTVLDRLSVDLAPKGVTALIGPNGAGKSVTLRVIDGLLPPASGALRIEPERDLRTAFVFQRPVLVRASAAANVALALTPLGLSRAERKSRTLAALDRVGLSARAGDPATLLSGGEQQRLALARAWAIEPHLLLLDEPTANLDPAATELVESLVGEITGRGTKVVLVSHNLGQVMRLASDVVVLSQGRAVEQGPTRTVLTAPRSPEAQTYIKGELPWTVFAASSSLSA